MHNRSVGLAFNMPREPDGTRWRTIFTALRSAVAGNGNTDISIRTQNPAIGLTVFLRLGALCGTPD